MVVQPSKAFPVIVVDDRCNLDQLSIDDVPVACTSYCLESFLYARYSIEDGLVLVDVNEVANRLNTLSTEWVCFMLGQSDLATGIDFVRKLARYNYMTPKLRNKNVVFSVPEMYLAFFARTLNESFNNLPSSHTVLARSGSLRRLFLSIRIERLLLGFLVFAKPVIRVRRVLLLMYRRLRKSAK